jgi:hypothetical protein
MVLDAADAVGEGEVELALPSKKGQFDLFLPASVWREGNTSGVVRLDGPLRDRETAWSSSASSIG